MSISRGKPIRSILIEQGYIVGTEEYNKAYERIRWSRRSTESKAKCGQRLRDWRRIDKTRDRMSIDPEFAKQKRAEWAARKANQRKARGEEINAKQRENYKKNRVQRLNTIKEGRRRRNPALGLYSILRDLERGNITVAEFLKHSRAAVDKLNSLGSGSSGE